MMEAVAHSRSPSPLASGLKSPHVYGDKKNDSSSTSVLNIIKQFDIYTKIEEDYRIRTSRGAICK